MQSNQAPLSPERLQMFVNGLAGMPPDEVKKAKILFVRNEMAELNALIANHAAFGVSQGCFCAIPLFWPILWTQRAQMKAARRMQVQQIRNALSTWRGDLDGAYEELDQGLVEFEKEPSTFAWWQLVIMILVGIVLLGVVVVVVLAVAGGVLAEPE